MFFHLNYTILNIIEVLSYIILTKLQFTQLGRFWFFSLQKFKSTLKIEIKITNFKELRWEKYKKAIENMFQSYF